MKSNQTPQNLMRTALLCGSLALAGSVHATNVVKADNSDNLDQSTSWVGGAAPVGTDLAVWNSTVTSANSPFLGQDANWLGLSIVDPGGLVNIGAGNILTLGSGGVDMSAATQDLTLGCDLTLGASQTWNVSSNHVLTLNGTLGGTGALLTKDGPGSLVLAPGLATTADSGLTVAGGTVTVGGAQAIGQLAMPGGTLTLSNGGHLTMNGYRSTSSTGWGSFTNPIVVPEGTTGSIDVFGRGTFSSALYVTGTLNVAVSFVRGDVTGVWSNSPGLVNILAEPDGSADFRIAGFVVPNFQRLHIGNGVAFYQAFNPPSGTGSQTVQPIGELSGDTGAFVGGNPVSGRFVNWTVGGLNTDATYAGVIGNSAGAARVTKVGTGTWTLSGVNTYTGDTAINAGKLVGVTGGSIANSTSITVANGAALGILVGPGGSQWTGNNITMAAGATTLEVNYAGSTPSMTTAPLNVRGAFTLNSAVSLNVKGGGWALGQYPLIQTTNMAGAGFAAIALGSLPNRVFGYLTNNAANSTIDLVVTNTTLPLMWATGNGTWDTLTANWVDQTLAPVSYQEAGGFGDAVLFEDVQSGASPVTVTLDGTVVPSSVTVNATKDFSISGAGSISGLGSLTKAGSGTLTLGTANSYSGGTKLNGGILSFATLANIGSASSPMTLNGGTLLYAGANTADISAGRAVIFGAGGATIDVGANNVTFTGAVGNAGPGAFTKAGAGSLTLSGVNNYSGNTTVSQGTLALASGATLPNSPMLTVNAGATLNASAGGLTLSAVAAQKLAGNGTVLGAVTAGTATSLTPGTSIGTLTFSNSLTFSGGTYVYEASTNSGHDLIVVAGDLDLTGGTLQVVLNTTLTNGTYPVIQYSGSLLSGPGSSANLVVSGSQAGKILRLEEGTGVINLIVETAGGSNITWSGSGADWDVETSFNWLNGVTSAQYLNGDFVTFDNTGAAQPFVNLTAALQPGGVTVSGTTDYTLNSSSGGRISGPASLTKNGGSTLTVLTANNNTGPTVINGGMVQVGNGATTGDLGSGNITNNGSLVYQQTDNRQVNGAISGTGSLTQSGATTLTLTKDNTYTGTTTVGFGSALQVGNGAASGTLGAGNTANDGLLVFNRTGTSSYAGSISGSGALIKSGASTLTLGGANSYTGPTTNNAGTLVLGTASAIPAASAVTISGGTVDVNGHDASFAQLDGTGGTVLNGVASTTNTLDVGSSGFSTTYGGILANGAGTLALYKQGIGTLILSGANTYSGGTVVAEGQLNLNNNTAGGTGAIVLSNSATLYLDTAGSAGVFPGNDVIVPADVIASLNSDSLGNGEGGNFSSGNSNSVLNVSGPLSFGSGNVKQFQNFNGTVNVDFAGTVRFSSTGLTENGGDNTTFQVEGTLQTRNGTGNGAGVSLGALTGNAGFIGTPQAGTGNSLYVIGAKGIDSTFSGTIDGPTPGAWNSITKVGAGKLTLNGTLLYGGTTTVSNGVLAVGGSANLDNSFGITVISGGALDVTDVGGNLNLGNGVTNQSLGGSGLILGAVTATGVQPVTIMPGAPVGTLTISNGLTLAANSAVIMELNRTNAPATNDMIVAASIAANGTLTVTNLGPDLITGDKFKLFSVPVSGFTTVTLPASNALNTVAYVWTNKLSLDGSIELLSGASPVNTQPTNIVSSVSGGNLTLQWPADHTGWRLQMQTNALSIGLGTNWTDVAGSAATNQVTLPVNPTNPAAFFRLVYP